MEVSALVAWLSSCGLAGIACLALVEKLILVLPSYILFPFLGLTVVGDIGALPVTIAATAVGSTGGALCWYGVGRLLGAERVAALVGRFGRYVMLSTARYDAMTSSFRRNQFGVTVIGQTIPAVRTYLGLPAGVLRLHPGRFLVATALGSLLWNAPLVSLGYLLRGSGYDPVPVALTFICAVVMAEALVFLAVRRRASTRRHY